MTPSQRAQVEQAAGPLPPHARQRYRQRVNELLKGRTDPGDADIWRASMQAQQEVWIAAVGMRPEF